MIFRNKIHISKKESHETKYWLELLAHTEPNFKKELRILWKECNELTMIFGKILSSIKQNSKI